MKILRDLIDFDGEFMVDSFVINESMNGLTVEIVSLLVYYNEKNNNRLPISDLLTKEARAKVKEMTASSDKVEPTIISSKSFIKL
jgi:hypothetical protein